MVQFTGILWLKRSNDSDVEGQNEPANKRSLEAVYKIMAHTEGFPASVSLPSQSNKMAILTPSAANCQHALSICGTRHRRQ
jgi:hypothetical protein